MSLNRPIPFFLCLSEQNEAEMWEAIKTILKPYTERFGLMGSEEEKIRRIGRYFTAAILSLVGARQKTTVMKVIYVKMMETVFKSQMTELLTSDYAFILNNMNWMENITINLEQVFNLYHESVPLYTPLQGQEKEDKLCLALLNAIAQVLLSGGSTIQGHIRWTVMFTSVFYCNFICLFDQISSSHVANILNVFFTPASSQINSPALSTSSTTGSSPNSYYNQRLPRARIPDDAKLLMNDIFERCDGFPTPSDIALMVETYKGVLDVKTVRTYFKNRRAKIRNDRYLVEYQLQRHSN